jgi:NAD(P)-dependent dehydrogenase (short-subunit alcohol dehydrogenase family)
VVGVDREHAEVDDGDDLEDSMIVIQGDVSEPGVLEGACARAAADGLLIGWVNNAASVEAAPLDALSASHLATMLSVNIAAVARGTSLAVRAFRRNEVAGSIVNVGSVHSRLGFAGHALYDASKGAVDALARSAAAEAGPEGIRCNVVAPGAVMTEREARGRQISPPSSEPIPRAMFSSPEEIAEIIAFLISPASSAINGAVIRADRGLSSVFVDERWRGQDASGGVDANAL